MKPRSVILGVALLATLAASWWAIRVDDEPVSPPAGRMPAAGESRATGPAPIAGAGFDALRVQREPWPAWAPGMFQAAGLVSAPPLPPSAEFVPVAPPLPFRYVGEIQEGGARAVILTEGDEVHIVRARQRIGERYRIEQVSSSQIVFTYLPLMERQVLVTDAFEQFQ